MPGTSQPTENTLNPVDLHPEVMGSYHNGDFTTLANPDQNDNENVHESTSAPEDEDTPMLLAGSDHSDMSSLTIDHEIPPLDPVVDFNINSSTGHDFAGIVQDYYVNHAGPDPSLHIPSQVLLSETSSQLPGLSLGTNPIAASAMRYASSMPSSNPSWGPAFLEPPPFGHQMPSLDTMLSSYPQSLLSRVENLENQLRVANAEIKNLQQWSEKVRVHRDKTAHITKEMIKWIRRISPNNISLGKQDSSSRHQ